MNNCTPIVAAFCAFSQWLLFCSTASCHTGRFLSRSNSAPSPQDNKKKQNYREPKMDIPYMKVKNGYTNDTDFVHSDFVVKYPAVAIPYMILTALSTLLGCVGNVLVIGGVLTYKVKCASFVPTYTLAATIMNFCRFTS